MLSQDFAGKLEDLRGNVHGIEYMDTSFSSADNVLCVLQVYSFGCVAVKVITDARSGRHRDTLSIMYFVPIQSKL